MQNTTPALESINASALLFVSGGCHKHHHCGQQQQQQCIINMPPAQPAQQMLPQVAQPQPQLQPDPSFGSQYPSTMVSTNVSINGQPIGGSGQPTAAA
jgi:hypothetical protein